MKAVANAVERWGDDWSVDRTCGTLGDISYAGDFRDAQTMNHLVAQRSKPASVERRKADRRVIVRGTLDRRASGV